MFKREKPKFPNNFFTQSRPTVSNNKTFADILPIEWSKEVISEKKKAVVYSTKEKKSF